MKARFLVSTLLAFACLLCESALAQAISGHVTNGTTGKPAPGIEVTLLDPMQGMAELTKTTTDTQGKFSLKAGAAQAQGPRLVRATHQGINYFQMAPPGTGQVDLEVYDAADKVDGISGTADVIRIQATGTTLQIVELLAVQNASAPPRTLAANVGFEAGIPENAQLGEADAQSPNGQPIPISPQPLKQKGRYLLPFALKPGETRFQLAYELPYSGEATISPALLRPWNHVVVVIPPSMSWKAKNTALFQQMGDPQGSDGNVQVASSVRPGQDLSFRISGTGTFPGQEPGQDDNAQSGTSGSGTAADNRPGGGLGPPIDAPDPLAKYRWVILGTLAVVLAGGAYISVTRRSKPTAMAEASELPPEEAARPTPTRSGNALLEAVKDELFQLEIERQQGVITTEDYAKQKDALDQTLKRVLERLRRG